MFAGLFLSGCPQRKPAQKESRAVPMVDATVYTFAVTSDREPQPRLTSVVVSGSKVRLPDELDVWRIIDVEADRVTTVDAVGGTFRSDTTQELVARLRQQARAPVPPETPPLSLIRTNERATINGIAASAWEIAMGDFRRELFLSDQHLVHRRLFPLWIGSDELGGLLTGRSAPLQLQLMALHGFPVLDRITMPLGARKLRIERRLHKVEKKKVPASLFEIPGNFRDLEAKESDDDRRSASSRRTDRNTRAEESRPSSRSERNP